MCVIFYFFVHLFSFAIIDHVSKEIYNFLSFVNYHKAIRHAASNFSKNLCVVSAKILT